MAKQKTKCNPGKHVFSGLDWAKKSRPSTEHFICKNCHQEIPFADLSPEYLERDMETARATLCAEIRKKAKRNIKAGGITISTRAC